MIEANNVNVYRRSFAGAGILFVAFAFTSGLLFFYQLPGKNLFWSALHNAGHSLLFFGLSFSAAIVLYHFFALQRLFVLGVFVLLVCIVFGGAVELIQAQVGREASWADFRLDVFGTVSGLSFFFCIYNHGWRRYLTFLSFVIFLGFGLLEPTKWRLAEEFRKSAFPLLADFENSWLNLYVSPSYRAGLELEPAPVQWKGNNSTVARVEFGDGAWPGISLIEVHSDWRKYSELSFEVFNPDPEPMRLVLRIHDSLHNNKHNDRFNRTYNLRQGLHQIAVPLKRVKMAPKHRELRMDRIRTIMFYSYKLRAKRVLYFDNIQLNADSASAL